MLLGLSTDMHAQAKKKAWEETNRPKRCLTEVSEWACEGVTEVFELVSSTIKGCYSNNQGEEPTGLISWLKIQQINALIYLLWEGHFLPGWLVSVPRVQRHGSDLSGTHLLPLTLPGGHHSSSECTWLCPRTVCHLKEIWQLAAGD